MFNAEDSVLSALLHRSIDRQRSGILGKETCVTAASLINLSRVKKGLIVFSKLVKGCRRWTNGCAWLSDLREVQPERNFEGFFDFVLDGSVILFFSSGMQSDSIKFELSNLITNLPRLYFSQDGLID